jgi:hypothetical protein
MIARPTRTLPDFEPEATASAFDRRAGPNLFSDHVV